MQPNRPADIIARIEKNGDESIVVALDEFGGTHFALLRQHYIDGQGVDHATPKGFALGIERLAELRAGIQAAEAEAVRRGLLSPADGDCP